MDLKKILSFSIGPIGAAGLGLITVPIVTWLFSAESIGKMSLVLVIASFFNLFFTLGLDQAYVREYYEVKDKPLLLKMTFFPGFIALSIVLIILCFFSSYLISFTFPTEKKDVFIITILYFITVFLNRFVGLTLRMQGKALAYSFCQLFPKLLLIFILIIYVSLSINLVFKYLLIANFISLSTITFIYVWINRQEWRLALKSTIDRKELKSMLKFGSPLILASLSFWGMTSLDRLFLRFYAGFDELGVYTVAVSFAGIAMILQSVFSTIWSPIVYKWVAEGEDLTRVFTVTEWMAIIVCLFFSLAGLFSWVIPLLLPEEFESVQYLFVICLAYPLFYTLSETTVVGINITKKTRYAMYAGLIALFVNILLNFILVPIFESKGAAISTAVSFWIFFICRTEFSCYVWLSFTRYKVYMATSFILLMLILFVFYAADYPNYTIAISITLIVFLLSYGLKKLNA